MYLQLISLLAVLMPDPKTYYIEKHAESLHKIKNVTGVSTIYAYVTIFFFFLN